jgi:hypothetical protein
MKEQARSYARLVTIWTACPMQLLISTTVNDTLHQQPDTKGTTMTNLTIKSRRNAYSIIGEEVVATSARDAATQAGLDWHVSLADVFASAVSDTGVSQL